MTRQPDNRKRTPTEARLFPFWVKDRGLSFFLAFLIVVTLFILMVHLTRVGRIGLGLTFALMVCSGAIATIRHRVLIYLVMAVTIVQLATDLMVEFYPWLGHWGWDTGLKVLGLAILVVMTLRHTFRPGPIGLHRVMGGIAAYMFIGLTWAFGYKLLMELRPDAIRFQAFIGGIPTNEPSRLIGFSFSTLTSVGYGDAYPVHRIARSLATAEALVWGSFIPLC